MKRSSLSILSIALVACACACMLGSAAAAAQNGSNVLAYWTDYHAMEKHWVIDEGACVDFIGNKSYEWRSYYYWTGLCQRENFTTDLCGKCINVTNVDFVTHPSITVRIIDTCWTGSLEMDEPAFSLIDSDGSGKRIGHLTVNYTFVDCDDPKEIRLYPQY